MKKSYLLFSFIILCLVTWISLNSGVANIHDPLRALLGNGEATDISIIQNIRAPRIAAGLLVGSALGIAGALSQGALKNPLAEPALIGTTGGAALATLLGILFLKLTIATPPTIVLGIIGAAAATIVTYRIARLGRDGFAFIVTGIAMSAVLTAVVGITAIMINKPNAQGVTFWSLGTLSMTTKSQVLLLVPIFIGTSAAAFWISPKLDYLALGDERARHLGVDPKRVRLLTFLIISISIGAITSIFGQISFLALAIPHIVRALIGVRHRVVLIHGAIFGSILLVSADLLARTTAEPNELPIGLVTALIGAQILIVAVRKSLVGRE